MRVSESRRKRLDFFDKLKKTLQRWFDKAVDILGKPVEALDNWLDRYERGYNDGIDASCEDAMQITLDIFKGRHKAVEERCTFIESVITELELNYPELHTEVDSIYKAVSEIRRQVK